jgi:hypothetical protein
MSESQVDRLRREELDDVKSVMGMAGGRRFIWRILEQAGIFGSLFSSDPLLMAAKEGQRNLGLMVFTDIIEACPEKYLTMVKGVQEREGRKHEKQTEEMA